MRKLLSPVGLVVLLLGATAAGQETPRAIIEKAIEAHGGKERLVRIRADRVKLKGVLFDNKRGTPFVAETIVQLPAQFKNVVEMTTDRKYTVVQILNGDKAYVTINGQPQPVEEAALTDMRETLQLDRAVRLVPLLTDKTFDLASVEEIKVNDRPAVGVKVTVKGHKELKLYFDKETGLLAKTEHVVLVKDNKEGKYKEVRQEEYYSDFKDLGGFKRPVKMLVLREGVKLVEAELIDVKYPDKIDDSEFAKP
jgi:hypothetical protein